MVRLFFFIALAGSFTLTAMAPQVWRQYVVIGSFLIIACTVLAAEHYTRKTITKQAYDDAANFCESLCDEDELPTDEDAHRPHSGTPRAGRG